mgnify:CR=1 FL=1|tara:strand:- start:990 stop:2261 length:1272 start_codon:yes stop_codon:yes gene_type:complete
MSFPAYEKYKYTGIDWFKNIPNEWETCPLKVLASINDETLGDDTPPDHEIEYIDIGSVSLTSGIEKREVMLFKDAPSRARRLVRDGDIIVSTVRTYLRAIAPITSPPENTVVSTGFAVVRPSAQFASHFAQYLLQAPCFVEQVIAKSTGVSYPAINASDMARLNLPIPPLSEQQTISAFLDHETAKIDALVEGQRRLIELLKEKRQAVISHTVTKGLNPTAPMKDSGIEWLGEVPEHWKISRLRFLSNIETGDADTVDAIEDGKYPFFVRSDKVEHIDRYTHDCEAVLTAGDGAGVGKVFHHYQGKFCAHQRVYIFCNFKGILGAFFFRYMRELFYQTVLAGTAKSTVESLRRPMIADLLITVPPEGEQYAIVEFINTETAKIDALIDKAQSASALLQERRIALISDNPFAKIDTHKFACPTV